jgi:hypothetical protein
MNFDWTAAAIVAATFLGPVCAVEIQKRLEKRREARARREKLFTTLMATRSIRVSPQHVDALNAIDLTFDGKDEKETEVRRAWAAYLDVLNTPAERRSEPAYNLNFDAKFIDLLYAISQAIGHNFDKTYLKNSWYRPQAHGDLEATTQEMQQLFLAVLKGEREFPVSVNDLTHN